MQFYAIEGNTQRLDGGAMFGNCPKVLWEKWTDIDEHNRIPLACRALLVQTDEGHNVLFEAGVGAFFPPKLKDRFGVVEEEHMLLKNLAKIGIAQEDIDQVVLSHLHFDHCGGVLSAYSEGEPHLLFPNAKFYVGKKHLERAQNPHPRDRASFYPQIIEALVDSGRLELVEGPSHHELTFGVRFHYVSGHTPDLMTSLIETPAGLLVFVSDLIPAAPWVHLPITMGYDRYPELVVDEKQAFLEEMYQRDALLFFTHDPKIALASIVQDEKGRYSARPMDMSALQK